MQRGRRQSACDGWLSICYREGRRAKQEPEGSAMLERMKDVAERALVLEASGTVMAGDVEAAVEAALGPTSAAKGLVIVINRDFDGYLAQLARGLANVSVAHKTIVRIAVVADAGLMEEAKLDPWGASAVPIRLFSREERRAAYDWAEAAGRGE
jgi:hypothetical protein